MSEYTIHKGITGAVVSDILQDLPRAEAIAMAMSKKSPYTYSVFDDLEREIACAYRGELTRLNTTEPSQE